MKNPETNKLMTRQEAADFLGVSLGTLGQIIHKRDFPALVRIGSGRGRVFINRQKLEEWIDSRTGESW